MIGDICDSLVAGNFMLKTGDEYLRRAKYLIENEQQKPNPDNSLIDFLCESVRLWREMNGLVIGVWICAVDNISSHIQPTSPANSSREDNPTDALPTERRRDEFN